MEIEIKTRSFVLTQLSIHSKLVQQPFTIAIHLIKSKNKLFDIIFNSLLID